MAVYDQWKGNMIANTNYNITKSNAGEKLKLILQNFNIDSWHNGIEK